MLLFVVLCVVARLFYSLNDVFIGRLARQYDRLEVGACRGISLGVTMAPVLFWVEPAAWPRLLAHSGDLLLLVSVTAIANLLHFRAAVYLPFGIRAALLVTGMSVCSLLLGFGVLDEHLAPSSLGFAAVLVLSAAVASLGEHGRHDIEPDVPKGTLLTLAAALLMAVVALLVKRLAQATDPLLTAWAWELGAGLVLVLPWLWRRRARLDRAVAQRFLRIGRAASPTAIGSAASVLALKLGELGLWGALAGTQVLFTAALGALWHRELVGWRRWLCFASGAAAVAGLALTRKD